MDWDWLWVYRGKERHFWEMLLETFWRSIFEAVWMKGFLVIRLGLIQGLVLVWPMPRNSYRMNRRRDLGPSLSFRILWTWDCQAIRSTVWLTPLVWSRLLILRSVYKKWSEFAKKEGWCYWWRLVDRTQIWSILSWTGIRTSLCTNMDGSSTATGTRFWHSSPT